MNNQERLDIVIAVDNQSGNLAIKETNRTLEAMELQVVRSMQRSSGGVNTFERSVVQMSQRSRQEVQRASEAAQMLSQQFGVTLPEGLRKAIAESRTLGSVMTGLFKVSVWGAAIGVAVDSITNIGTKLGWWGKQAEDVTRKNDELTKSVQEQNRQLDEYYDKLVKIQQQRGLIGLSGSEREAAQRNITQADVQMARSEWETLAAQANKAAFALGQITKYTVVGGQRQLTQEYKDAADQAAKSLQLARDAEQKYIITKEELISSTAELNLALREEAAERQKLANDQYATALARVNRETREIARGVEEWKRRVDDLAPSLIENARLIEKQTEAAKPLWQREPLEPAGSEMPGFDAMTRDVIDAQQRAWDQQQRYAMDRIRDIRDAAGHIFDDLVSGSKNMWENLLRTFQSIFLTPIRMAFQNLAASIFGGFSGGGAGASGGWGGLASAGASIAGMGAGGTPPYFPSATGGSGGWGGLFSGFGVNMAALKNFFGVGGQYAMGQYGQAAIPFGALPFGQQLSSIAKSPAAMMGGGLLALGGLQRGGLSGMVMSSAGLGLTGFALGAKIGAIGGPLGAAIGAGAGLIAGLFGLGGESPEDKMRKKVKDAYGVNIRENDVLRQLIALAQQSYVGSYDRAIRSDQGQELIRMYAQATGQTPRGMRDQMTATSLIQSGGGVYQAASYSNGVQIASSGGLQTYSLDRISGGNIGSAPRIEIRGLNLIVDGARAAIEGEVIRVLDEKPRAVAASVITSGKSSSGRRELASALLAPGTLTS